MFLRLFENFVKFPFYSLSLRQAFPLGGRWTKQSFGRMRGATCFLPELFQSRVATCSSASRFPLREPLSNCRFKAIPASKVARSADRGLFKISPYVAASPCLHKILLYVKASPCFFLLSQKSAKIVSRYAASPRGEAPPRGGGEGRNLFSIRIISIKSCNLFVSPFLKQSPL